MFNLFKKKIMKKDINQNLQNPDRNGVIIVETAKEVKGKERGTEAYQPRREYSSEFRIGSHPTSHDGKFNPNKIVFFGEEIFVYAKNRTLKFNIDGTVEDLPVDSWDSGNAPEKYKSDRKRQIKKYGL